MWTLSSTKWGYQRTVRYNGAGLAVFGITLSMTYCFLARADEAQTKYTSSWSEANSAAWECILPGLNLWNILELDTEYPSSAIPQNVPRVLKRNELQSSFLFAILYSTFLPRKPSIRCSNSFGNWIGTTLLCSALCTRSSRNRGKSNTVISVCLQCWRTTCNAIILLSPYPL